MTTIAYKDGVISYDSRITSDNIIQDDDFDKHHGYGDTHFFFCGSTEDMEDFANLYLAKENPVRDLDVSALVFEEGKLFKSSVEEKEETFRIWKSPVRLKSTVAIGSGRDFALAFMDSGMSSEDAIKATAKRDTWTGGKVRTFKLP